MTRNAHKVVAATMSLIDEENGDGAVDISPLNGPAVLPAHRGDDGQEEGNNVRLID